MPDEQFPDNRSGRKANNATESNQFSSMSTTSRLHFKGRDTQFSALLKFFLQRMIAIAAFGLARTSQKLHFWPVPLTQRHLVLSIEGFGQIELKSGHNTDIGQTFLSTAISC